MNFKNFLLFIFYFWFLLRNQKYYDIATFQNITSIVIKMLFKNSRLSFCLCQLQLKTWKMSNSADLTLIYSRALSLSKYWTQKMIYFPPTKSYCMYSERTTYFLHWNFDKVKFTNSSLFSKLKFVKKLKLRLNNFNFLKKKCWVYNPKFLHGCKKNENQVSTNFSISHRKISRAQQLLFCIIVEFYFHYVCVWKW